LTFHSNYGSEIFNVENVVTLKSGSEITEEHLKWYHSIDWVWFPISFVPKTFVRYFNSKAVTLKTGLGIRQGHMEMSPFDREHVTSY